MNRSFNKDDFWKLIRDAKVRCGQDTKSEAGWLIIHLIGLGKDAALRFQLIMDGYLSLAEKYGLLDAASLLCGGCSDDGFFYFRGWLIAQGKEVYLAALEDPDSLADVEPYAKCSFEALCSVGYHAYKNLTGESTFDVVTDEVQEAEKALLAPDIKYRDGIEYPRDARGIAAYFPRLYEKYVKGKLTVLDDCAWNADLPKIRRLLEEGRRADRERLQRAADVAETGHNRPLFIEKYGETYPIRILISTYVEYGNLAIEREALIDGVWEPWDTLTVNLAPCSQGPNCAFLDVNNCGEECVSWLLKYGFGELLGRVKTSGFCRYPEFRFSEQKLREIDIEAYETHIQNWEAYHHTTWPRTSECATDAGGLKG